jgi:hypothetical protein
MLYLVNDILDYAQSETHSLIVNNELVSIKNVLNSCKAIMLNNAESKGI